MADIVLNIVLRDEASAKIQELQAKLRVLRENEDTYTRRMGEYAGSRYIANQTRDIEAQVASLRSASSATGELEAGFQGIINRAVGAEGAIKSASASARVLRTSLPAAAASDPLSRGETRAAPRPEAAQGAEKALQAANAERQAMLAGIAASEAAYQSRRSRAPTPIVPREEEESAERLAQRLAQVKELAAATRFNPELMNTIESLTQRLTALAQSGATGGAAFAQFMAAKDLETQVSLQQSLAQAAAETASNQRAILNYINAANSAELGRLRTANAVKAATHEASSEGVQDTINRTTGVLQSVELLKRSSASTQLASKFGTIIPTAAIQQGKDAIEGFNAEVKVSESVAVNWGQTWRHIIAIVDGALRGQRGQVAASFNALARDSHLATAAVETFGGAWLIAGAAGVAALAEIGYQAEQAFQRFRSIRDTQNELALKGFGSGTGAVGPAANAAGEFDAIKTQTNEYAGTVKNLQEELNKLPPAAQASRDGFRELAVGLAGIQHLTPEKAIEPFIKAASESPEALAKLLTTTLGLQNATTASGQSLEAFARSTASSEDAISGLVKVALDMRKAVLDAGKAGREAGNDVSELALGAAAAALYTDGASESMTAFADAAMKAVDPLKGVSTAADSVSKAIRDQNAAIDLGNSTLDKRIKLLQDLANAQAAAADTGAKPTTEGEYGDAGAADANRRRRAQSGTANLQVEVEESALPPAQAKAFKLEQDQIRERAQARRADLASQATAADQTVELARREAAAKITTGRQEAGQPPLDSGVLQTQVEGTTKVEEAEKAALEAHRRVEDERVEISKMGIHAQVNEEARGDQERITLQQQIIAIDKQQVASGREDARVLAQDKIQLATLVRQAEIRQFQAERDDARAAIELAKGQADAVDKIVSAYDHLRDVIANSKGIDKRSSTAQVNREEIRDLESQQSQAFSQISEFNNNSAKLANLQVQAAKASFAAQAAAHGISKEKEAEQEADFTHNVMAQQEQRVESELTIDGLTEKNKQQLYQTLADLYEKDAVAQEEAQKKVTAAIEAENEKRAKSFTQFFDTAGSALEKFVDAGLTRSTTLVQAEQQLARSLIGGVVKTAGSLASDFAGKFIGPKLGLTEEQSKGGLGDVLGNAVAKAFGLLKDTPQDKATQSAALMQKAVEAQTKATGSFTEAVANFNKITAELDKFRQGTDKFSTAVDKFAGAVDKKQDSGTTKAGPHSEMGGRAHDIVPPASKPDTSIAVQSLPPVKNVPVNPAYNTGTPSGPYSAVPKATETPSGPMSVPTTPPSVRDLAQSVSSPQSKDEYNWLQSHGYTPQASAAVVGNSITESSLNPKAEGASGELGLFQELGPRRKGLESYATSSGRSPTDWQAQMEYMDKELQQIDPSFKSSTNSASNLAGRFERKFERPASLADAPQRGANAEKVLADQQQEKLASNIQQLNTSTTQNTSTITAATTQTQQNVSAAGQDKTATDQNTQALNQNTQKQNSTGTGGGNTGASSSTSGDTGSGVGQLVSGFKGLAGAVGNVLPGFRQLSGLVGTVQGVFSSFNSLAGGTKALTSGLSLFDTTTKTVTSASTLLQTANVGNTVATTANTVATQTNSAAESASAAGAGAGSALKAIPLIGGLFARGGIVPSAEGGMIVPGNAMSGGGQLSILHPREMVLPANISDSIQSNMGRLSPPTQTTTNSPQSSMSYAPQITGRFGTMSRGEITSILRTHGDMFESMARNMVRNNNGLFRG